MLTVFNVGQGDSLLLSAPAGCDFCSNNLLIDAGPAQSKIHSFLKSMEPHVLLTHSDSDHIGGFKLLINNVNISSLILPYYYTEVVRLWNYLDPTKHLSLPMIVGAPIKLVCENSKLCNLHSFVFNPPADPHDCYHANDLIDLMDIEAALGVVADYFTGIQNRNAEIIDYRPEFPGDVAGVILGEYAEIAKTYVHLFFKTLAPKLRGVTKRSALAIARKHLNLTANQASIVFKYVNGTSFIFTGDADVPTFNRIISRGYDIRADVLKVPHHGSKNSLNGRIMCAINPSIAIVCHNNGRFGNSKDTHPHYEIINLLDLFSVESHYTNDVIKNNKTIISKRVRAVKNGLIQFVR